jgi:hypothetical protein
MGIYSVPNRFLTGITAFCLTSIGPGAVFYPCQPLHKVAPCTMVPLERKEQTEMLAGLIPTWGPKVVTARQNCCVISIAIWV